MCLRNFRRIFLFLCLACLVRRSIQSEEEDLNDYWQHVTPESSLGALARLMEGQFFPATEWDPIPVFSWLQPPGTPTFKIYRCKRVNVANCTHVKNPELPKHFQGAYFQDTIPYDEELVNAFGKWNAKERSLNIEAGKAKIFGAHDTSSRLAPGKWFWLPSGASHLNTMATMQAGCLVYLNEDGESAQIIGNARVLGFQIYVPGWMLDWRMRREPDGSWIRTGVYLGIPLGPISNYVLRPVLDGDLKPAKYFDKWVKAWDGRDFFYLDYA